LRHLPGCRLTLEPGTRSLVAGRLIVSSKPRRASRPCCGGLARPCLIRPNTGRF